MNNKGILRKGLVLGLGCVVVAGMMSMAQATATLSLSLEPGQNTEQGSVTNVTVVVSVGSESVAGIKVEITLPSDASLSGLYVDGATKTSASSYDLGTITANGSSTLKWSFKLYSLGINSISVKATGTAVFGETKTAKKYCHRVGSLNSKIALVKQEASELTAIENLLSEMGLQYTSFAITQVSSGSVDPATYPGMIIYSHDSALTSLTGDQFLSAIRNYIAQGGNILLSGTAPELLDLAGITNNAFTVNHIQGFTNNTIGEVYVSIDDTGHPITEGYSPGQDIQVNYNNMWLAYGSNIDPNRGFTILGHHRHRYESYGWRDWEDGNYRTLGEVPYERGRVIFLSTAYLSSNQPTTDLKTLISRSLDYLFVAQIYSERD